jgi:alkanesulfonate monooxygenase SsuD/methylene tetrahydromethanopterin reductase-like flavin-dependent oxidoreductase (luciferase family)
MRIGGAMFFTDYSMSPTELARALEDRGFDSLWVPEHSHIPLTRKSPASGTHHATSSRDRPIARRSIKRSRK